MTEQTEARPMRSRAGHEPDAGRSPEVYGEAAARRAFIWVGPRNQHEAERMTDDCHGVNAGRTILRDHLDAEDGGPR